MTVEHLVTLVGSNPMSSFAALATLRPSEATFVHTAQSADSARRLADAVGELPGGRNAVGFLEVDPTDFLSTRFAIEDLDIAPWHLDYTGGTKSMSCAARLAFEVAGVRHPESATVADPDGAHYVDDFAGLVRSDSATAVPIDESSYDLDTIAMLHGCRVMRPNNGDPTGGGTVGSRFELRVAAVVKAWNSRCNGLAGDTVPPHEVVVNLDVQLAGERKGELDVTVQRGRRVGVVSCYSGSGEGATRPAKLKLFEVMQRASQLAGDLARMAVAAPINPEQVTFLYEDLGPRWGPRRVLVLGERELHAMERGDFAVWDEWWGPLPGVTRPNSPPDAIQSAPPAQSDGARGAGAPS